MLSIEVDGINELQRDLTKYGKDAEKAINKACKDTATNIESDAKKRLKGMLGSDKHTIHGGAGLLGSISPRFIKMMEHVVGAWSTGTDKYYAPYIEFGIGEMVFTNMDFSDEAKAVAAQFKGKKKVKGFKGDSFLNWAAINQEKKHIQRIENELNKLNK